ncbi:hypothetical protein H0H93_007004 [Arthromyces matolae]|nr:hypothetical protein H0H93_007004 [Arthromyces matolae]
MPKKEVEKETSVTAGNFWKSPRRAIYAVSWILLFCIAASVLGLVSEQLQRGGNSYANYGNMMFKHVLGILLFTVILTFLMFIGHFYGSIGIAAVFWGVGAGVLYESCPYRAFNCGDNDPMARFAGTRWGEERFFSQCSRIVAMQGLAWAACASPHSPYFPNADDASRGPACDDVLWHDRPLLLILGQTTYVVLRSQGIIAYRAIHNK